METCREALQHPSGRIDATRSHGFLGHATPSRRDRWPSNQTPRSLSGSRLPILHQHRAPDHSDEPHEERAAVGVCQPKLPARYESDGLKASLIDGEIPGFQMAPILLVATDCQPAGNAGQDTGAVGEDGASSAGTPIQFQGKSTGIRKPLPDKAGGVPSGRAEHRHGQIGRVEVHHPPRHPLPPTRPAPPRGAPRRRPRCT